MEITSYEFLGFVVICLAVFHLLPGKFQNIFLLAASYYFYYSFSWKYPAVLAGVTIFNFVYAQHLTAKDDKRPWPVLGGIIVNIVVFSIFLFGEFFAGQLSNLYQLLGAEGITTRVLLPIGFSYYLLESISYLIDVKRKQMKASHNFFDFALYLAYFPKLVSGPIERARIFLPQLSEARLVDDRIARRSVMLILVGLTEPPS
ncbi:MAG: hypothetical protein OEV06_02790, partial [Anaerolineae bacterium]|nr:hypothetical protein [Anaerolineae bacterium]